LASIIMPAIAGIIADKYIPAQKLLGLLHIMGGVFMFYLASITNYDNFFWVMFGYLLVYMPTIGLNNAVSYSVLENNHFDIVKTFPPIRVWGTIGFIVALWAVDFLGWAQSSNQFLFTAAFSVIMGVYSFTMPNVPCSTSKSQTLIQRLGLDAFVLFKDRKMAIFFIFSMMLGIVLQISNAWGSEFLRSFNEVFPDSFAVKHSSTLISLSQISETAFILTIPFFLKRFGIKAVMLMSMVAWFFRFALFGLGNPEGVGLGFLVLSMIVYGMAFDFFNISGSLFVETETDSKYRSSAQGLFMLLTNGLGAFVGGYTSGLVVDYFTVDGLRNWVSIWFVFAAYALVLAIIFAIVFKYKHNPEAIKEVKH